MGGATSLWVELPHCGWGYLTVGGATPVWVELPCCGWGYFFVGGPQVTIQPKARYLQQGDSASPNVCMGGLQTWTMMTEERFLLMQTEMRMMRWVMNNSLRKLRA